MNYRKQKQRSLKDKTELRWSGAGSIKSGIIKIHIGGSPN